MTGVQTCALPIFRIVWFLRNTHDVSPTGLNAQFQAQIRARMAETIHPFEAYTPLERVILGTPVGTAWGPRWCSPMGHELDA